MGEGESVETFGKKERDPPLPQPSFTHLIHLCHDPPISPCCDLAKKKHHHRDLATPRSTTNRPPLHIERNREWETERQSRSEGERIEGERENHWRRREDRKTQKIKREKKSDWIKNYYLVLQSCYNAILHLELHCSTIVNFLTIVRFCKTVYKGSFMT